MDWVRGDTVGHGSFGKVSLAIAGGGPSMVVKSCGASSLGSLMNEKLVLDQLQGCPEIIRCFGDCYSFENGEKLYNVLLEFASRGALSEKLKTSENRRFSEIDIRKYSEALLRGLHYIHKIGFVHCDIKLQNILLCGDGQIKIADFGLAKRAGAKNSGWELRGTPMYMSPEMVNGGEQGAPADIWALGCAVVEMASGAPVWNYSDMAGLLMRIGVGEEVPDFSGAELSDQGRDFLEKCFIKDPRKRWTAEMLLNHRFISDHRDGVDGAAAREDSVPTPSPRCPFDFPDWVSVVEEEEIPQPSLTHSITFLPSPEPEYSPAERLQGMFSHQLPNWCEDSEEWVKVR